MTVHPTSETCPFCNKSVYSSVFYARAGYLAVYNIAPVLPGHSLVIPEKHYTGLLELSDQELFDFFNIARTTLRILIKAFNTDAFDWSIQEKPEAGQTVEHLHLHIVPRLKDDLPHPGAWYPLIHQNDQGIIDSFSRPLISNGDMHSIIHELKRIAGDLDR
jgi:bis(5'-adenosyl)-triphosphatase